VGVSGVSFFFFFKLSFIFTNPILHPIQTAPLSEKVPGPIRNDL
jgi:hypothetical protein